MDEQDTWLHDKERTGRLVSHTTGSRCTGKWLQIFRYLSMYLAEHS